MFDKLVESKERNSRKTPRQHLIAVSSAAVITTMGGMLIFSLFNQTLAMADEFSDLTRLVNPITAEAPKVTPANEPDKSEPAKKEQVRDLPTRIRAIARADTPPAATPAKVSSEPSKSRSIPQGAFRFDSKDTDPYRAGENPTGRSTSTGLETTGNEGRKIPVEVEKPKEVKAPPKLPKADKPDYIGVVNGKAIELPIPTYPPPAKAMGINGAVKVEVLIDENGNVLSANAIEGNGLLRRVSVLAAKRSRFSPTTIGGKKVKVRGIIIYNFK
jgi:protein TonB